jgi:DNA-binding LacI/PurR family transcriptional regulator
MTGAARRPGITDVARLAGVSHQTVSRVLNGAPKVSEDARRRVQAAIRELRYRPSWAARTLATGRPDLVGVVTVGVTRYRSAAAVTGFERAAAAAGLGVQVSCVPAPDPDEVQRAAERLLDHGVAGLVVQAPTGALRGPGAGVPVIGLGIDAGPLASSVRIDQVAGAAAATCHLLAAGHRTVWHVGGPPGWPESAERAEGWRQALRSVGAVVPPVVPAADWSPEAGYAAGRVLRDRPDVTAVFAADDSLALGLLRALTESGLDVPGRVSVVGFDDVPDAAYFWPPLTTVRPDYDAAGRAALEMLLARLTAGDGGGELRTVTPSLVVRSTAPGSGPPPGSARWTGADGSPVRQPPGRKTARTHPSSLSLNIR